MVARTGQAEGVWLYIHGKCHMNSPTWAVLSPDGKTLRIICAKCQKRIGDFAVDVHGAECGECKAGRSHEHGDAQ